MLTPTRSRAAWSGVALLASVVATLAADGPNVPVAEPLAPLVPVTCWSENFDGVVAPALPIAWKSLTLSGTTNPWTTIASGADTAPNRVATGNPATVSDNVLQSAMIAFPPGASTLTFRHSFNTEAGQDGGVLEIAYFANFGVGSYTDIVSAGGSFVVGGYNATLNGGFGNPLGGRPAWSGNSGGFITTTVTLPAGAASNSGKLRWRMGTDSSTAGSGWSIDSATVAADPCGTGALPGVFSKVAPDDIGEDQNAQQPLNLTLVWAPSAGAVSYEYCVYVNAPSECQFDNPNWTSTGANTSVSLTNLAPSTVHRWHVRAINGAGTSYSNSNPCCFGYDVWRFTTQPLPPAAFSKTSPLSGSTNRPTTLALNWTASTGATGYEVCLDTTDNGACGSTWEPVGNITSFTVKNLAPSTTHSWQVRAINIGGTTYADAGASAFTPFKTASLSRIPVVDFDGSGTGDVLVQELSAGQWSWQRYVPGGGFVGSGGTQDTNSSLTPMNNNDDARTDGTRFNSVTGAWQRLLSDGVTFSGSTGSEVWWQGWQRHVLNLDGDGVSDFFLYDPATGTWFQCPAAPNPSNCHQGGWNPGWEIYPMRLNNDAFGDFFLFNPNTGRWFWALGTGPSSWNFTYPVTETWFSGWKIYPGDFNGDGLSDLLLHDPPTGNYFVVFSTGTSFTYVQGGWSVGWTPIVADLNGDGIDDVFRHDPTTGTWTQMISNGSGGFTKVGTETWSQGWQIRPTDFDGDGKADFFLYHPGTGVWYQARNTGPGTFAYTSGTWKPGLKISTGAIGR